MDDSLPIAILISSLKLGGAERVTLNLASALQDQGERVDILLMSKEGEFLDEATAQFNVVDLKCHRTWVLPFRLISYFFSSRPKALVCSFWKLSLCACLVRIFAPRMRLLLWEHAPPSLASNSPAWLFAISSSVLYRLATRIICVSSGVKNDVAHLTVGLRKKLQVIYNPITPPVGLSQVAIAKRDGRHIVWVGRLCSEKNPELALEAFASLAERNGVFLSFIGDGPLYSSLVKRSNELKLNHRVDFLGFLKQPYDVMESSDILVLSSKSEGLGNVLIEALYCGLSIASTDCGLGVREVLGDGRYGRIAANDCVASLAAAIESELNDLREVKVQQLGAERFLPEVVCRQFLSIIND